jgi:hypothetical protein
MSALATLLSLPNSSIGAVFAYICFANLPLCQFFRIDRVLFAAEDSSVMADGIPACITPSIHRSSGWEKGPQYCFQPETLDDQLMAS